MDKKAFGNRIKAARKAQNLTAEQLAEVCNINATYLRQIEGGAKVPSMPLFVLLCQKLRVSSNYLLKDTLVDNEYSSLEELARLAAAATPAQLKLIAAMINGALGALEE